MNAKCNLIKYIKYLISVLLIFGLTVNECPLYSQSNTANSFKTSEIYLRNKLVSESRTYFFCKNYFYKSILLFFLHSFVKLQFYFSQKIQIILKLQTFVCFKIENLISTYLNLYKTSNSNRTYSSLYIG